MRFVLHVSSIVIASASAFAQTPFGVPLLVTGDEPTWVAVADLDGDGRNDVVTTDSFGGTLSVFESIGRGRFKPAITLHGVTPYWAAFVDIDFADIDRDGDLDIVTANETPATSDMLIYLNDGSGGFATPISTAVGGPAYACAVGDVDQDTWPDIVVTSGGTVRLFRSIGGGNFAAPTNLILGIGSIKADVQLGDVDGDGDLDLVTATASSIVVRVNTGGGTFAAAQPFASDSLINRTVIGDWNGDARADLALVDSAGHLDVLMNNGSGAFGAPTVIASGASGAIGIAAGDLNGDGRVDLAMTNYDDDVLACFSLGGGAFGQPTAYPIVGKHGVAIADVDGDGHADILATRGYDERVAIALGDGQGGSSLGAPLAFTAATTGFRTGDVDLDGIDDVVALTTSPPALSVRLGLAAGGFGPPQSYSTVVAGSSFALVRVDADAYLDALVLDTNSTLRILSGNGSGGFGAPLASVTLANSYAFEAGDFDGDALADIVYGWAYVDTAGYYWTGGGLMHGNGAGGFTLSGSLAPPSGIAFGDFNEDGHDDLALCQYSQIFLTRSNAVGGGYTWSPPYTAAELRRARAVDVNGDGHLDVIGVDDYVGVYVLLGDGTGALGAPTSYATGGYARDIAVADFDGDGDRDAAVSYSDWITCLDGLGTGLFAVGDSSPMAYPNGALLEALDANRDGLADLVLGFGITRVLYSHGAVLSATTYCTSKTTSNGCVPSIGSGGSSSATATSGFTITCASAINNKSGLLFYSLAGRAEVPFQGGTMCVRAPRQRTPLRNSGGNSGPNDCSGNFALDFNAFAHGLAGGSPSPALTTPGIAVTAQWWGRDPLSIPSPTMLSNALDFLIGP